jgi:hypothetical protein
VAQKHKIMKTAIISLIFLFICVFSAFSQNEQLEPITFLGKTYYFTLDEDIRLLDNNQNKVFNVNGGSTIITPTMGLDIGYLNSSFNLSPKIGILLAYAESLGFAGSIGIDAKYNPFDNSIGGQFSLGASQFIHVWPWYLFGVRLYLDNEYSFEHDKNFVSVGALTGIDIFQLIQLLVGPTFQVSEDDSKNKVGIILSFRKKV